MYNPIIKTEQCYYIEDNTVNIVCTKAEQLLVGAPIAMVN